VEVDPNGVTPLGFSAQAVLDLVVGEHTMPLAWLDSDVEYGPEGGRSEITLTITAARGPLLVDRELAAVVASAANFGRDDFVGAPSPCRDSLRVPASVAITTSSGAFDEAVDGIFEAYEGDFAHGGIGIDLAAIRGSFNAAPAIPEIAYPRRRGSDWSSVSPNSASPVLSRWAVTFESADSIGVGMSGEIAHFPADEFCGPTAISVGAEQTVRGLSVSQALASLNAAGSATVRYLAGGTSKLDLDFSSAAEGACARFDSSVYGNWPPGIMTLDFPGAAQLTSTDGLIDGSMPVIITTTNQNDAATILTTASAEVENTTDAESAAALPAQLGIRAAIDVSEYDGVAVEFSNNVWSPIQSLSGVLKVYGLDIADCVINPRPRDPNATRVHSKRFCAGCRRRGPRGQGFCEFTQLASYDRSRLSTLVLAPLRSRAIREGINLFHGHHHDE
jgi:hypothetical protein